MERCWGSWSQIPRFSKAVIVGKVLRQPLVPHLYININGYEMGIILSLKNLFKCTMPDPQALSTACFFPFLVI